MYLKKFRENLNLTQKELANLLGIAQNAIARYENDKVKPTSTVILKYVEELNANPNFLFLGEEPYLLNNLPKFGDSVNNSLCFNNDISKTLNVISTMLIDNKNIEQEFLLYLKVFVKENI
ncbi:helix-turn-helix domain-containing protein [Aliarcobacter butzleri]|uniref:helix-turn-helix domain-containing protein n=1 Tax=Aliarcobacter butzleri TaxID=28197 RepID=UPI003B21854D